MGHGSLLHGVGCSSVGKWLQQCGEVAAGLSVGAGRPASEGELRRDLFGDKCFVAASDKR